MIAASLLDPPLIQIAGLITLGVGLHWCAARFRMPAVVLLLGAGLLIGPVTGWLQPRALFGDLFKPLVALAIGFVLFEGGLSLHLREARQLGSPLVRLVLLGLVISFVVTSILARFVGGLSWPTALTVGAILIVTGPTVIRPMLRHAHLTKRPALLLKWEGIVNDPLGALVGVIVVEVSVILSLGEGAGGSWTFLPLILAAGAIGSAAAYLLSRAMDGGRIPEHLKTPAMVAGVAVVFVVGDMLFHEAGLLATTAMGVVFANVGTPNLESIRGFKEDVTTLLIAVLFLVLAANLDLADLSSIGLGEALFVASVLLVARPTTVWGALSPSRLPRAERFFIGWIAPRGVVAAAMGAALQPRLVEAGVGDADRIVPVLFATILATVLLHGLTAKPLAQRLGLSATGGRGLLVVGASRWAFDLCAALQRAGVETVLVDSDYRSVNQGRLQGLSTHYGEALDEETLDDLPTEMLGSALVATTDDHYNALVSVLLHPTFGRENVVQVTAPESYRPSSPLQGEMIWGEQGSFGGIARRYWSGARFRVSTLSEEFTEEDFRCEHPDALVLFTIKDGTFAFHSGGPLKPGVDVVHIA